MPETVGGSAPLRDHDYFETAEGWVFMVLGDVHPEGRVWSCLKYVPGDGIWGNGDRRYVRVFRQYTVSEMLRLIRFLEEREPSYVFLDPTVNAKVIAPPRSRITKTYSTRQGLAELLSRGDRGPLETNLVSLIELLSEYSGVPRNYFGVTGSILLRIYHQNSDMDLVVYGVENVWRVIEALKTLEREGRVSLLGSSGLHKWAARASEKYPVPQRSLLRLASRVANKGMFNGVEFSIHGVREKPELKHGEVFYSSLGMARVTAKIIDARESLLTPAVYHVEDMSETVDRIVCYDMMLAGLLREGDYVEVYGKLESAHRDGEEAWRQILVGSYEGAGREYIKIL